MFYTSPVLCFPLPIHAKILTLSETLPKLDTYLHPIRSHYTEFTFIQFIMGPWTDATERKLLLCMVDAQATHNWAALAGSMGEGFSDQACR